MRTVEFTAMKDGTREDYLFLKPLEDDHVKGTGDRVLRELRLQEEETLPGYKISRLEHGLQAATRAWNDGADIDWVVAALLHDIGDGLAPQNHDRFAAEILRPYLREEVVWTIEHHASFQMYYYAHHYGWNQHEREIPRFALFPVLCGLLRTLGSVLIRSGLRQQAARFLRTSGERGFCPQGP